MSLNHDVFFPAYDNDVSSLIPSLWALESISILQEQMVAANRIHRDFEPLIARFGDTVNTRKPSDFTAKRKTLTDNVTVQDAIATNVAVKLDQHVHVSFLIRDGEESKSFKELVMEFLRPAMIAQARFLDKIVLGQYSRFYTNSAGRLGNLSGAVQAGVVDTRRVMNINKAPDEGRTIIWTPNSEAEVLKTDIFTSAERVGDMGSALREASIGRKLGFDHFMCQNMSSLTALNDTVTGAINLAAGYPAGTSSFTVDGLSAAISNGCWIKIAGDDTPLRVVSTTGGSTPTAIVTATKTKRAVVNDAVVTIYSPGQVNYASGYAAGYAKTIVYDTFTLDPQVGQMVTFGTTTTGAIYTIIDVDTSGKTITLDRPLEAALADDAKINIAPPGEYNFAFCRNALALVVRPLAEPQAGTGARSAVVSDNGLSLRVVITYDGNKQGHLVTLDMLCGIAQLDSNLGAVLLG